MTETDWTTVSVRVPRETRLKLEKYCDMEETTANKLLRELLERELKFMDDPKSLREKKGLPLIGSHEFQYICEKDNFIWELDIGSNGKAILSEEITPSFINNLKKALDQAIDKREKLLKKIEKNKGVIPKEILKFEVKKNAGQ